MTLIDRVQDVGRVISCIGDKITKLHNQIEELKTLKAVAMAEQRAADLEGEVG